MLKEQEREETCRKPLTFQVSQAKYFKDYINYIKSWDKQGAIVSVYNLYIDVTPSLIASLMFSTLEI